MDAQDWRIGCLRSEHATGRGEGSAEEQGSKRRQGDKGMGGRGTEEQRG
jgi:hypothetical protein